MMNDKMMLNQNMQTTWPHHDHHQGESSPLLPASHCACTHLSPTGAAVPQMVDDDR